MNGQTSFETENFFNLLVLEVSTDQYILTIKAPIGPNMYVNNWDVEPYRNKLEKSDDYMMYNF